VTTNNVVITGKFRLRVLTPGREWVNEFPLLYKVNGRTRLVEARYISDLVSRPWFTAPIIRKWGLHGIGSLKHDNDYWFQDHSRASADRDYMAINLACGVSTLDATAIWSALRVGGGFAWRNNARKRRRGESAFYCGDIDKLPIADVQPPKGIIGEPLPEGWAEL
jgi:hypothetical protein